MSNWRDPSWRNVKDVMDGLEGDTRDARAGLFGDNVINIDEKPIIKLLIDEVHLPIFLPAYFLFRCYIHSIYSKSFQLFYGQWINTTTTRHVSSSSASRL
jgi:hypothetical protein